MDPSRQSAVFSVGSDSSSVYSDDEHKSDSNPVDVRTLNESDSRTNVQCTRRESAKSCEESSTVSLSRHITALPSGNERSSSRDESSSHTAAYRFETLEEAQERRSRIAAQARPEQPHWRDTGLNETRTYMQQVLAEHDAAIAKDHIGGCRLEDNDNEELIARHAMPPRRHLRMVSADNVPPRRTRIMPISKTSLASSNSGGTIGGLGCDTGPEECILQGDLRSPEATRVRSTLITPRPRAKSLPNTPPALRLDEHNSFAPGPDKHQSAALSALAGANREPGEAFSRESSGQWLGGPARRSLLAARRRGRADWQKSGLFSSTGQQYGLGDRDEGYSAGKYVTIVRDDVSPEKGNRKRDAWRRVWCFS